MRERQIRNKGGERGGLLREGCQTGESRRPANLVEGFSTDPPHSCPPSSSCSSTSYYRWAAVHFNVLDRLSSARKLCVYEGMRNTVNSSYITCRERETNMAVIVDVIMQC